MYVNGNFKSNNLDLIAAMSCRTYIKIDSNPDRIADDERGRFLSTRKSRHPWTQQITGDLIVVQKRRRGNKHREGQKYLSLRGLTV